MFEIKLTIEAKELSAALSELAKAVGGVRVVPAVTISERGVEMPVEKPEAAPRPMPTPAPAPMPAPAPTPTPAPMPAPTPAPAPSPAEEPKPIDLDTICRAGAWLTDQGKMPEIMQLFRQFNVQTVTQLRPEDYARFAEGLRALGANI